MRNGMMAINEAVGSLQDSFNPMQKADSATAILMASCLMELEKKYNKVLQKDRDQVIKDALLDPDDPNKSGKMQTDANQYYIDSTKQDDATQSFRGAMDTEKGQAGQDSDNYKDFVAFQQGVIGVTATLTNLISKHY